MMTMAEGLALSMLKSHGHYTSDAAALIRQCEEVIKMGNATIDLFALLHLDYFFLPCATQAQPKAKESGKKRKQEVDPQSPIDDGRD
jgi:hypothetical protein